MPIYNKFIDKLLDNKSSESDEDKKKILLNKPQFGSEEEIIKYFSTLLSLDCKYKDFNGLYNQNAYYNALNALIAKISDVYTERIIYNIKLKEYIEDTLVPYYLGRFTINMSREISFLPLELRIFLYTELLSKETVFINQTHLLDRIALTLFKANEDEIGNIALILCAWNRYTVSKVLYKKNANLQNNIIEEYTRINESIKLREKILCSAQITKEIAGREFFYALKGFADITAIHNFNAALLNFDAFYLYYLTNFKILNEVYPSVKKMYQKRESNKDINKIMVDLNLNEIKIVTQYYSPYNYSEDSSSITEKVNAQQKTDIHKRFGQELIKDNNYINAGTHKTRWSYERGSIPNIINFSERGMIYERLVEILEQNRVKISDVSNLIFDACTAMMRGDEWDLRALSIETSILSNIDKYLWKREDKKHSTEKALLKILMLLAKKNNYLLDNSKWPIGIFYEPVSFKYKIAYSANQNSPLYWGEMYIMKGYPNNESDLIIGQYISNFIEVSENGRNVSRQDKKTRIEARKRMHMMRKQYCER